VEEKYNIKIEKATPDIEAVGKMVHDYGEMLFFDSKEKQEYCCKIRKVDVNNKILDSLDVWITGLRADQSKARAKMRRIGMVQHRQRDGKEHPLLKVTPLIDWSEEKVKDYLSRYNVPVHKLLEIELNGWHYASLGCVICTTPVGPHESRRAGRWRWFNRELSDDEKECGLHLPAKKEK
jgi:phosphoadenosine phosphosulfate reductase